MRYWRAAIAVGCQNALVYAGLGQALFFTGDFSGAASALAEQIASGAADRRLVERFALARFLEAMIAGDAEAAFAAYREAAGSEPNDPQDTARTAFHILSAYGHRDAALRLGRSRLASLRDDPIQRYLLDAVAGEELDRAPRDYLVAYFDRFAETFDKQLVEVLGYDVPEKLARLVARERQGAAAGGRSGLRHRPRRAASASPAERGSSGSMCLRACSTRRRTGKFTTLSSKPNWSHFSNRPRNNSISSSPPTRSFISASSRGFSAAAARVTPPGGLVAFNVETTWDAPFVLLPSGRFAHAVAALQANAAPWFELRTSQPAVLRVEANAPVHGALIVLERRAAVRGDPRRGPLTSPRPSPAIAAE